jgi:hypothetical protein
MKQENKIEELTKLLKGFLSGVPHEGYWKTYTDPRRIAEYIVKNFALLHGVSESALKKIKAISIRTLDMNLKNDVNDEYDRMDNALEEIWSICNNFEK